MSAGKKRTPAPDPSPRHGENLMALTVKLPLTALGLLALATPSFAQELNALVWCDHTDPELVAPFEEKFGVKVNVKEYEGTAAGLAILDQSQPGDWDVMVIDRKSVV